MAMYQCRYSKVNLVQNLPTFTTLGLVFWTIEKIGPKERYSIGKDTTTYQVEIQFINRLAAVAIFSVYGTMFLLPLITLLFRKLLIITSLSAEDTSAFSLSGTDRCRRLSSWTRTYTITHLAAAHNSRRQVLSDVASLGTSFNVLAVLTGANSAHAGIFGGGSLSKVNSQLSSYGLPSIQKLPDGFTPLLKLYGRAKNRSPLLVEFVHPIDWVVTVPNIDKNGEEGTIQAGQYAQGDTATLFVVPGSEKVKSLANQPKEFFQDAIIKAITQKGSNVYQNFKVVNVEPTQGEYNNQEYILVDFKYELLTGAGFTVDRTGVASITSEGNGVQLLWTASTRTRYKKTEPILRTITKSFRCYSEGLQFSSNLADDVDV